MVDPLRGVAVLRRAPRVPRRRIGLHDRAGANDRRDGYERVGSSGLRCDDHCDEWQRERRTELGTQAAQRLVGSCSYMTYAGENAATYDVTVSAPDYQPATVDGVNRFAATADRLPSCDGSRFGSADANDAVDAGRGRVSGSGSDPRATSRGRKTTNIRMLRA